MRPMRIGKINYDCCVNQNKIPILVVFGGFYDHNSRRVYDLVDYFSEKYDKKLLIGVIEYDHTPELFSLNEITEIPTLIIFEDGKPYNRISGNLCEKDIEAYIRRFFGIFPYEIDELDYLNKRYDNHKIL